MYVYICNRFMLVIKVTLINKIAYPKSTIFSIKKEPIPIAIKTPQLGLANTPLAGDPNTNTR